MSSRPLVPLAATTLLALALAACGSSDPSTVALPPSPTASGPVSGSVSAAPTAVASSVPSDSVDQAISVTYANGAVSGGVQRVKVALGSKVRLTVTSDKADEVHVHLYDITQDVAVNQPTSLAFVANKPGVLEVELEKIGKTLLTLQVG